MVVSKVFGAFGYPLLKNNKNRLRCLGGILTSSGLMYFRTAFSFGLSNSNDFDISLFMDDPITNIEKLKETKSDMKTRFELFILKTQADVCRALEAEETNKKFMVDKWTRSEGGGGITCILQDGDVFEKAGVNISIVSGTLPPQAIQQMKARGKEVKENEKVEFFAAGVSSVVHPRNPNIPTVHFNYRYFETKTESGNVDWWFGGGTDLTPYYLDEDDVTNFHKTLKTACDAHNKEYYAKYKDWCDYYFFIPHRAECRGVGGIFFDDLNTPSPNKVFQFVKSCAEAVIPSYLPIVWVIPKNGKLKCGSQLIGNVVLFQVKKHKSDKYGDAERYWQLIRRGRYAEFNLIYDRGTKFGLYTPGARHESILMSLPPLAKWEYMHHPYPESKEAKLMMVLKQPKRWV